MKPDLIVIGAMKCASSTVCAYFEDHPDVFMVPRCEPNYFSHDENFAKGVQWYEDHFTDFAGQAYCGEGSNYYSARALYPETAARMAAYNPKMKIIYMVRDPMKRIVSAWVQTRVDSGDAVPPSVDEAVRAMPDLFIGQSLYWHNLEPYRALFPEAQIFVGFMEDLKREPEAFFSRLCAFLGVAEHTIERSHQNPSAGKYVPSAGYTAVNKLPLTGLLKRALPDSLKQMVKQKVLSTKIDSLPDFSVDARTQVLEQIAPDAKALLAHCGKPEDFWAL